MARFVFIDLLFDDNRQHSPKAYLLIFLFDFFMKKITFVFVVKSIIKRLRSSHVQNGVESS